MVDLFYKLIQNNVYTCYQEIDQPHVIILTGQVQRKLALEILFVDSPRRVRTIKSHLFGIIIKTLLDVLNVSWGRPR